METIRGENLNKEAELSRLQLEPAKLIFYIRIYVQFSVLPDSPQDLKVKGNPGRLEAPTARPGIIPTNALAPLLPLSTKICTFARCAMVIIQSLLCFEKVFHTFHPHRLTSHFKCYSDSKLRFFIWSSKYVWS